MTVKQLPVRLFFNLSVKKHYIQIGDCLFEINYRIVELVYLKEGIEVQNVADVKEMQEKCK